MMSEYKIGVLLPRSSLYPQMGTDLSRGLKSGLHKLGYNHVKLIYENIGFGANEGEIYGKAEKLLLQEEVLMIIVFIEDHAAIKLDPLFVGTNRLLLVLDPGAHVAVGRTSSPNRFTLSLHTALCCRLTGYKAAMEGASKVIFATSFYESGYLSCFSYQRGIELGGGQVLHHCVVPYRLEEFQIDTLREAVNEVQPDAVLALFSPEAGGLFLKQYANAGLHEHTRLFASPFMLEEQWLSSLPFPFEGISGCVTWSENLLNPGNRIFMDEMINVTGSKPTIFTMLGWEAAQFSAQAIQLLSFTNGNTMQASEKLDQIVLDSPRGILKMDKATRIFLSPMHNVTVVKNELNGNCCLELRGEVLLSDEDLAHYLNDPPQGVFSRWTNTYLCI